MRLKSVFPAPFGPMMAFRSPGKICRSTSLTACSPPKLLDRRLSSRTGRTARSIKTGEIHHGDTEDTKKNFRYSPRRRSGFFSSFSPCPPCLCVKFLSVRRSLAVSAWREIPAVDGLLQELDLAVGPELTDIRISLDNGVPQLVLVVAEHLFLLDLLDVDVLYRVPHIVEADRTARGVHFDGRQQFDELLGARPLAARLFHGLVDHMGGRVVALREVGRNLAIFGAVFRHEGRVLRSVQCGAVLQRRDVTDDLVAHR